MLKKKCFVLFLVFILLTLMIACNNDINTRSNETNVLSEINQNEHENDDSREVLIGNSIHDTNIDKEQLIDDIMIEFEVLEKDELAFEDVDVVDDVTFSILDETVGSIDFYGEFINIGNESSAKILDKYFEAINDFDQYIDINTNNGVLEGDFDKLHLHEYIYYYFDMDGDFIPELIVSNGSRYVYIFKYSKENKISLIHTMRTSSQLLGNNNISNYNAGIGLTYGFYKLDSFGERYSEIRFYSEMFFNDNSQSEDVVYLVGFPQKSLELSNLISRLDKMKVKLIFDDLTSAYYFSISEEQYNMLISDYLSSKQISKENISEVMYTYEELFADN